MKQIISLLGLLLSMKLSEVSAVKISNGPSIVNSRDGYSYTPGIGSYKLYTQLKDWNEARKACRNDGAHLAIINSREEEMVLLNMLEQEDRNSGQTTLAYIGIHDYFKEGEWVTIFGEPLNEAGYSSWVINGGGRQPDNYGGNENCGTLTWYYGGGFNDVICSLKLAYICELPYTSVLTLHGVL